MFVELLLGVMANAGKILAPLWDGVVGWECHFSSPMKEGGDSVGDEKEVEDEEEVRLEASSAPEDVTS